jgi:PTH1 family peptidyl-tRNA hydrolase
MVLLYDDSDLPLGALRVRPSGRAAGHRGVASVMEALGTEEICRVRIGIGRPGEVRADLADYVLSDFESDEQDVVAKMISRAVHATEVLLKQGVKSAMNLYNRRFSEPEDP